MQRQRSSDLLAVASRYGAVYAARYGANPPLDFAHVAYTARIDGGSKQITELDLDKPGKYALLCFVSDRKGGPPHVAQGMVAEITVH